MTVNDISKAVSGKCVSEVTRPDGKSLVIRFTDGSTLLVERQRQSLSVTVGAGDSREPMNLDRLLPTARQAEYLDFIKKYMQARGVWDDEWAKEQHRAAAEELASALAAISH